jgi:hypothetical protein
MTDTAWLRYDDGSSIGEAGSEGGVILRDDEYQGGARITLERGRAIPSFAITCGAYGWMVHTRFFSSEAEAEREYAAMLPELAALMDIVPLTSDPDADKKRDAVYDALSRFLDQFP